MISNGIRHANDAGKDHAKTVNVRETDKEKEEEEEELIEVSNLTILNLWLIWFGPMREDRLARGLLLAQLACGLFGLFVRHRLALYVFTEDNL